MPSMPRCPHSNSGVNGGWATSGSATLILRMIRKGEEEQEQPDIGERDRPLQPALRAPPSVVVSSLILAQQDGARHVQDRYTSSSHSTVRLAERRRFWALTWTTAPLGNRTRYSDWSPNNRDPRPRP